jgi:hypothetical protein
MKVINFVRKRKDCNQALQNLKQTRCAHCRRMGTLNRHDRIQGNDPDSVNKQILRGRRVWCSNRGRRGGCGLTMRILFARLLPRHSANAKMLSTLLKGLCGGGSVKRIWEESRLPMQLQSCYHLLKRLRDRLDTVRAALLTRCKPPGSRHSDPLRQTAEHLRCAFPGRQNLVEAFQHTFQTSIMG